MTGLLTLALLVVCAKWLFAFLLFAFYYGHDYGTASLIAVGLSQISEFSFVLASHGRSMGIISREAYFLMLGTTALTFLSTPFLWRLSTYLLPPNPPPHADLSDPAEDAAASPPQLVRSRGRDSLNLNV